MATISIPNKDLIVFKYPETWITPRQQLDRLIKPLVDEITKIAQTILPSVLITLMAEYACEDILIIWYEALRKLNLLQIKIPPLPEDILEKFQEPCSFDPSLARDKAHMLTVIPQELESIKKFNSILNTHNCSAFDNEKAWIVVIGPMTKIEKIINKPFGATVWELMTTNVLPQTKGNVFNIQLQQLEKYSYASPSLKGTTTALVFHKIVTGIGLYPDVEGLDMEDIRTSTSVEEMQDNAHITVGCFIKYQLMVRPIVGSHSHVGLAGVIRF